MLDFMIQVGIPAAILAVVAAVTPMLVKGAREYRRRKRSRAKPRVRQRC